MSTITSIIRNDLLDFKAYRATPDRADLGHVWLNANESPYPQSYSSDIHLNRYPPRHPKSLLTNLANYYQLDPENFLLSRGSDEAIDLLIRLCCTAGQDQIIYCPPTFHIYEIYAKLQGAGCVEVPLLRTEVKSTAPSSLERHPHQVNNEPHFSLSTDDIKQQWQPSIKLIFICTPNNPTGHTVNHRELIDLCHFTVGKALVIVDEAYIDFSDEPSLLTQLTHLDNLVVLRTFSKAFGLAGIRFGFAAASKEIIQWLYKIAAPYPLPSSTILAVETSLTQENEAKRNDHILEIKNTRSLLQTQLLQSPWITYVWPSQANFLLVKTIDSKKFIAHCLERGVILRDYSNELGLENCVRITVGSDAETKELLNVII